MGSKKSKAPKPNYQEMANRLAQWQYEDAEWYRISLDEAENVHNRELGRAKARYASSGGSTDKIGEIEAEHKRKLEKTKSQIKEQYEQKQQTLKSGPTYQDLFSRFHSAKKHEILKEFADLEAQQNKFSGSRGTPSLSDFQKERGVRITNRASMINDEHGTSFGGPEKNVMFLPNSPTLSDEVFMDWARSYGNWKEPAKVQQKMEEIKTRAGEKPRRPIMGTLPIEQNPWI